MNHGFIEKICECICPRKKRYPPTFVVTKSRPLEIKYPSSEIQKNYRTIQPFAPTIERRPILKNRRMSDTEYGDIFETDRTKRTTGHFPNSQSSLTRKDIPANINLSQRLLNKKMEKALSYRDVHLARHKTFASKAVSKRLEKSFAILQERSNADLNSQSSLQTRSSQDKRHPSQRTRSDSFTQLHPLLGNDQSSSDKLSFILDLMQDEERDWADTRPKSFTKNLTF